MWESEPPRRNFWETVKSTAASIGKGIALVGEAILKAVDLLAAADVLARKYNWCLSTTWPPELMLDIGTMAEHRSRSADVNLRLVTFYSDDDWARLVELIEDTCRYRSVNRRRYKALRDLPKLIRAAERDDFDGSAYALPRLFGELEGILRDASRSGILDVEINAFSVRKSLTKLMQNAAAIEKPGLRMIRDRFYKDDRKKDLTRGFGFNRHRYAHGKAKAPSRVVDTLRVVLMINLIAYLIDVREYEDAEHLQVRRFAGEVLSQTVKTGRKIAATKQRIMESQAIKWVQ